MLSATSWIKLRGAYPNQPRGNMLGCHCSNPLQMGSQAVVFGPGDIRRNHQTGEFVPIAELLRCEEIVEKAISCFCGGQASSRD